MVHLLRSAMKYASYTDRKTMAKDMKPIYTAATVQAAEMAMETFAETWGTKAPGAVLAWRNAWEDFTPFLAFTPEIRKVIYTTNQIESINYQLRKITKTRGSFPSAEAAILAPKPELIARLEENGLVVVPSIGAARHTGQVATTLLLFLLTSDSRVPDVVKKQYFERGLQDTVVSARADGMSHRVLRTGMVNALGSGSPLKGMSAAVQNADKFKSMTGMKWQQLAKDGLNMKKASDRTWQQIVMAANSPMLLKARLVEGNTGAGVHRLRAGRGHERRPAEL